MTGNIAFLNGGASVAVSAKNPLPVNATVTASVDTTGLATSAGQNTEIGYLSTIATNTTGGSSVPTGSAGSPNASVLSVQGISGATALPVSAAALPLPTGAATATNQATANTALAAIETAVQGTLAVSAAALPLPTGAATAANQSVLPIGSAAFAATQVTVGTSATSLASARTGAPGTGRIAISIYNNGSVTIYIGGSGVTTSTGFPLLAGNAITLNTTAQVYAVSGTASQNVGVLETF